jgi:hypothetical protein
MANTETMCTIPATQIIAAKKRAVARSRSRNLIGNALA